MNATSRSALLAAAVALAAACSRPEELPDVGVSRTALAFEAPGGTGEPAAQTFYVVNTGRGDLARPVVQIAYDEGAGWLAASVAGSSAPYKVTVRSSVSGLAPRVYGATLTVSCGNASSSPVQVDVTLTVPDPRFTLSTESVTFDAPRGGGDPAPKTFLVLNGGRGTLPVPEVAISYVGTSGWLSAAVSGTPDAYTVTLTPAVAGVDSGSHSATVSVGAAAAPGPPRTLTVTLNVPPAELAISAPTIRIDAPADGADPAPVAVAIANPGGGLLDVPAATISYPAGYSGAAWLAAVVSGTQAPFTVTLQATQSVTIGTYTATVAVASSDALAPAAIAVTFVVPQAKILLTAPNGDTSAGGRTLGASFSNIAGCPLPPPKTFVATNVGAGALPRPTWTLSPASIGGWLSVSATGDYEPYQVTLAVTRKPAADEAQGGYVMLGAPGAWGATIYTSYTEEAVSSPTLSISPVSLSLYVQEGTGDPIARKVEVTTKGICSPAVDVSVTYADGDPAWIETTATTVALNRHEVTISPRVSGMIAGTNRSATVAVKLAGRPDGASVPVTLTLGAFEPSVPMVRGRYDFTLTALPWGRAIAVGSGDFSWTPEIWDAYAWREIAMMVRGRDGNGATWYPADGEVLVCGGMFLAGPDDTCEALRDSTWEARPPLTTGRDHPALVPLPSGKVLVVSPGTTADAEIYDPRGGPSVPVAGVNGANAVQLTDGTVLVVGEHGRAWTYDPEADAWTETGPMPEQIGKPALGLLADGGVLAVAGTWPPVAERWDPETRAWHEVPGLLQPHAQCEVTGLSMGKVLVIDSTGTFELFDPDTETWSVAAVRLPTSRLRAAVVALPSGRLLIAGGENPSYPNGMRETFTW